MIRAQLLQLLRGTGAVLPPPQVLTPASLTSDTPGRYQVGDTITYTPPTYTPGATLSAPAWKYADGTPILAASGLTYMLQAGDVVKSLRVTATISQYGYTLPVATALVGPVTAAPVSTAPNVANQNALFGSETLAGAGDWYPTNTGSPITAAVITSGDTLNQWQVAADGKLTPKVSGGLAAATLNITYTAVSGETDTATISVVMDGHYSVATTAQMSALVLSNTTGGLGIAPVIMSGRKIKLREKSHGGTDLRWNSKWFYKKAYTSRVQVTSHGATGAWLYDSANMVAYGTEDWGTILINRDPAAQSTINYLDTASNVEFYRINMPAPWLYGVYPESSNITPGINTGAALTINNLTGNLTWRECNLYSNWKELVETYGFDTLYKTLPPRPSDGKVGFQDGTSWGFRGMIGIGALLKIATGCKIRVIDCAVHDTHRLLQISRGVAGTDGSWDLIGNMLFNFATDAFFVTGQCHDILKEWNTVVGAFSQSPPDTAHRDASQDAPDNDMNNMVERCNDHHAGRSDSWRTWPNMTTDVQGRFKGNMNHVVNGVRVGCYYNNPELYLNFDNTSALHGISVYNPNNGFIGGNLNVQNPSWNTNPASVPVILIRKDNVTPVPPVGNILADNAALGTAYQGGTESWGVLVNNVNGITPTTVAVVNGVPVTTPVNYADYFVGMPDGSFEPTTIEEALACFTPKPGSAMLTAIPKVGPVGTGYRDRALRRWDYPRKNPTDPVTPVDQTGVAAATLITSAGVQITGIKRTQTIINDTDDMSATVTHLQTQSVNGAYVTAFGTSVEVRVTTAANGTGVVTDWTAANAPGGANPGETRVIVKEGQYLFWRMPSGASGTTRTVTGKVGDTPYTWNVSAA